MELKDKIAKETSSKELAEGFRIPEAPSGDNVSEAMSALMVLGYTQAEAASAVSKIDSSLDSGEIIKRALKIIGSQMKLIETGDIEFEGRAVAPEYSEADTETEFTLRPQTLQEYIGQDKVKENLAVYIEAAKRRGEPLDHVLLYGPPGLGKTTLAGIIAHEMGANLRITTGPAIEKPGDLAALLTNLSANDVLFIDEIHRPEQLRKFYILRLRITRLI